MYLFKAEKPNIFNLPKLYVLSFGEFFVIEKILDEVKEMKCLSKTVVPGKVVKDLTHTLVIILEIFNTLK